MKNHKLKFGLIIIFIVVFLFTQKVSAEDTHRTYYYPSIDFDFQVNKDSSVDVIETENFVFNGQYNLGWRSLKLNKIDDITDIEIIDKKTDSPLKFVDKRLDKYDPSSWGFYTTYRENNSINIEWYYNLKDTNYSWIIKYKLHGAIGFYKDHDELYWNLLTDFTVPINYVMVNVYLPADTSTRLPISLYRTYSEYPYICGQTDERTFVFMIENIQPNEKLTIAPGWQKDIVSKKAYWQYYIFSHWGLIVALILLILSILGSIIFWYITEKRPIKKMTVIPQYEPPENLPPAMADILLKENITKKAWPATVIDLACRGYLKIEEVKKSKWSINLKTAVPIIFFIVFLFIITTAFIPTANGEILKVANIIDLAFYSLLLFIILGNFLGKEKDFILYKLNKETDALKNYEKMYLNFLFKNKDIFSTKEERKKSRTTPFYSAERVAAMRAVEENLFKEMDIDMNVYKNSLKRGRYSKAYLTLVVFAVFLLYSIIPFGQLKYLLIGICISIFIIFITIINPRLNNRGIMMKVDWFGFKLYLKTAERYRLQNLTPDLFEKYLPYAIIFGIEKKWAKSFERMNLKNPSWYIAPTTSSINGINNSISSTSFSPSSFVSSFSSSFSSSFGGGSSGSGGGGGAGGGGGGGGGGAS